MMDVNDFDMDEPLTLDVVAEAVGTKRSVVVRLVKQGLIESVERETGDPVLSHHAVVQLRRMQRLRRDLGVNFAGTTIILQLVGRIEQLNRELDQLHQRLDVSDESEKWNDLE